MGGNIVSPYTAGYSTDPLFTTSMIAGLVEKGAGKAAKSGLQIRGFDDHLLIQASYAIYNTLPILANSKEFDLDLSYWVNRNHMGLKIRNRFGIEMGKIPSGQIIYNRVMLSYLIP